MGDKPRARAGASSLMLAADLKGAPEQAEDRGRLHFQGLREGSLRAEVGTDGLKRPSGRARTRE